MQKHSVRPVRDPKWSTLDLLKALDCIEHSPAIFIEIPHCITLRIVIKSCFKQFEVILYPKLQAAFVKDHNNQVVLIDED